jgi:hypothetical protein
LMPVAEFGSWLKARADRLAAAGNTMLAGLREGI